MSFYQIKSAEKFLVPAEYNFVSAKLFHNADVGIKTVQSRLKRKNNLKGKLPLMKHTAFIFIQ